MMYNILTRKYFKFVVMALVLASVLCGSLLPVGATETKNDDSRVVIISMPRLSWETLEEAYAPEIDGLIDRGAIATLSVRVLGSLSTPAKGYATLSAGRRATAVDSREATFLRPNETYGSGNSGSVIFTQQRGDKWPSTAAALGVGYEATLTANRDTLDKAEVGSFAQALQKKHKKIAVFGNADSCIRIDQGCYERSVAYLGADKNGVVRRGDISRELLMGRGTSAPLRIDYKKMYESVSESIKTNEITVAECSDLERIDSMRVRMDEDVANADTRSAIKRCDVFIGNVLKDLDLKKDQIYIISPNAPRDHEQTTVFVVAGKDVPRGYASSSTTRIRGAVTLVDIAPSLLKTFDIAVPEAMNQSELDWRASSDSSSERISVLREMNERAIARDQTLKPVIWFLVFLFALMVLVSMTAFTRMGKVKNFARYLCCVVLCLPLITFVLQPFMTILNESARLITAIGVLGAILGAALFYLCSKAEIAKVILGVSSIYLIVQVVDIVTGGRLQFNSIFGNATIVAGRFAGFNNQSFALLASAALIFVAMVKEVTRSESAARARKISLFLVAFLLVILVVDGAPQMGSDVGGVLTFTPTVVILAMMLFNRKVNFKALVLAGVSTAVALGVFTAIDLARPANKRTHLGRYAEELFNGDGFLTIERKFVASMRSFTRPEMTLLLVLGIAFIVFLYTYRTKVIKTLLAKHQSLNLLIYPGLFLSIIGALLNDSGVTVPSLMMLSAIPAIALLGLDAVRTES